MIALARLTARTDTERLAAQNLPLVPFIVRKFANRHHRPVTDDDLSAGMDAIYRAAELFDPNFGTKFSTYACNAIYRRLQREMRGTVNERHSRSASSQFGDNAAIALDSIYDREHADTTDCRESRALQIQTLRRAFAAMRPTDAEFVRLYYLDGLNYRQIGERHGICKERVRQIIERGLDAARLFLSPPPSPPPGESHNGQKD